MGMCHQVVLEGNNVNMDVTSPAATLALALMYLKTNDEAIAASFAVPDTHFALDHVKPEFVLLRVQARGLVMWKSVRERGAVTKPSWTASTIWKLSTGRAATRSTVSKCGRIFS